MNKITKQSAMTLALAVSATVSHAAVINFSFTGQMTVAGGGSIIVNNDSTATPISANLSYDTVTGIGSSDLSISIAGNAGFLGVPAVFHDITMSRIGSSNFIDGNILVDWNGNFDMPLHVQWDASGLFNAIDIGLQAGDTISGTTLIRAGSPDINVGSAQPFSDTLFGQQVIQNFAPLAATSNSLGLTSGPFMGVNAYIDIGSGNSLHVTSVSSSAVPVPAAVWLFGSGLIGLIGLARRKA